VKLAAVAAARGSDDAIGINVAGAQINQIVDDGERNVRPVVVFAPREQTPLIHGASFAS
jgi:hypothetical protein